MTELKAHTSPIEEGGPKDQPLGLNTQDYIQIGGISQWVTIKGSHASNPVILFVHGGPGNPLSLYSDSVYQGWEREFTLVHWDQRGSGKTYEVNQEVGELTIERLQQTELSIDLLVRDGLELTDYLLEHLGKRKLIITGSSWGSVLAVKMAQAAPANYHFYVGLSQLVNYHRNMQTSYQLILAKALERNDQANLGILASIGKPPWTNPRSFGQLRKIIRAYEQDVVDGLPELKIEDDRYLSDHARAAYFSGEEFSFVKFVGLEGNGMAQSIELDKTALAFDIPVYLIQGEADLLTVPDVTREYFNKFKAPTKEYISVAKTGHDPTTHMLNTQLEVIRRGLS